MNPANPDVIEAGRVLATLDDWRAIMFVLIFLLVIDRIASAWQRTLDRREGRDSRRESLAATERLASAIDRMTSQEATREQASMLHNARVESMLARIEPMLRSLPHGQSGN